MDAADYNEWAHCKTVRHLQNKKDRRGLRNSEYWPTDHGRLFEMALGPCIVFFCFHVPSVG